MLNNFFVYQSDLSEMDKGMNAFGAAHIGWIIGIVIGMMLLCRWYAALAEKRQSAVARGMVWLLVGMKSLQLLALTVGGHMAIAYLPLHLCGMAIFVCFLDAYIRSDFIDQTLYSLCMPGAWLAILFPDWTAYPAFSFENIYSFASHAVLVIYPAMQLAARRLVPNIRRIWKPMLFLGIVLPPVYIFNKVFNTNFFFINWPSVGSPLVWLEAKLGTPGYLFAYAGLVFGTVALMYAGYMVVCARKREIKGEII